MSERTRILLSPVGTTDPVRGLRDGPLLHIVRHYRPAKIYVFITAEMRKLSDADHRYDLTIDWVRENMPGYDPEWIFIDCAVTEAHDLDQLDGPLHDAAARAMQADPDADLLLNLSSGTPQIQMIMAAMAMDLRYRGIGVQVSNPERQSGTTARTNTKTYDPAGELELNDDNSPEAPNRCTEPKMLALQRENNRRYMNALLDQRNFAALADMADSLPAELGTLARHLAARSRLDSRTAVSLSGSLTGLPFPLYPYKSGPRSAYAPLCEYYLLMRNLLKSGNVSRFLLHMEPLTLQLQLALLACQTDTAAFIRRDHRGHVVLDPAALQSADPGLYAHYHAIIAARRWEEKTVDVSTMLCDNLLSFYSDLPSQPLALFAHYAQLKDLRNGLAHSFSACTEQDIISACHVQSPEILLQEIEATIRRCYSACDPAIFTVYDRAVEYIRQNL